VAGFSISKNRSNSFFVKLIYENTGSVSGNVLGVFKLDKMQQKVINVEIYLNNGF